MRLLHSTSLDFHEYHDDVPSYLILSHTWGASEVSYQEMRHLQKVEKLPPELRRSVEFLAALEAAAGFDFGHGQSITQRSDYKKILATAAVAKSKDYDFFWIDTCCIEKDSSAELQEAINSMFVWHQRTGLCVV